MMPRKLSASAEGDLFILLGFLESSNVPSITGSVSLPSLLYYTICPDNEHCDDC